MIKIIDLNRVEGLDTYGFSAIRNKEIKAWI